MQQAKADLLTGGKVEVYLGLVALPLYLLGSLSPVAPADWQPRRGQWCKGVVAALHIGAMTGVVLGFLAMLPFFLGLFFFLLLGLVPGAVLFRFAYPLRPIPARSLFAGSLLVLLITWLVAGYTEYRSLSGRVAVKVRKAVTGGFPDGYRREVLNEHIDDWVNAYLRQRYGSDGPQGYVRWAATSGRIEVPPGTIELRDPKAASDEPPVKLDIAEPAVYRLPQPGILWCVRVLASLALLTLSITMQVVPLRKPETDPEDDPDEGDPSGDEPPADTAAPQD